MWFRYHDLGDSSPEELDFLAYVAQHVLGPDLSLGQAGLPACTAASTTKSADCGQESHQPRCMYPIMTLLMHL